MSEYLWTDDARQNVIRVDDVGDVVVFFPDDDGYGEAAAKVTGVADVIDKAAPITPEQVRSYRDELLVASDWTQVADAPVDQSAWATYRQALRDITDQAGFPSDVDWPAKP